MSSKRMKRISFGYLIYHVAMYTKNYRVRIRIHIEKSTFLNKKIIASSRREITMLT